MKLAAFLVSCSLTLPSCGHRLEAAGFFEGIKNAIFGEEVAPPPAIKVLLSHGQSEVLVEVQGSYVLYDPNTGERVSSRFLGKGQYFRVISGGLKWGEEFPGIHQLQIVPDEDSLLIIGGKRYRGSLYIYDVGGTVSAVNEVPIEDYLCSIFSDSSTLTMPQEALAAIAIAARTQAYYAAEHPKTRFWAVNADIVGYRGVINVNAPIQRAIKATRYMVMSRTSAYEKMVTPFPAQWDSLSDEESTPAHIAMAEVEVLAKKGHDAAYILRKAFPDATITITYP